ncbi:MAG: amidophosphoribosyltransferase [Desulfuromonas sp.]|nr:MAG: amidophosphoribosyltransferase [Desulfuromonas sp.]
MFVAARGMVHRSLRSLCDLLLPPRCLLCEMPAVSSSFCSDCLAGFRPLPVHCPRCALPFAESATIPHLCGDCLSDPPAYDWTEAAGLYEGSLRHAIHLFKFEGRIDLDRPLARQLLSAWEQTSSSFHPDRLVPVPLHPKRLRQRGCNQALLLAHELGRSLKVPVATRLLRRTQETPAQQGLSAENRHQNLKRAFALEEKVRCGERLVLIDDVMTTGATAQECARLLRRGGAAEVGVMVLGRARRHLI